MYIRMTTLALALAVLASACADQSVSNANDNAGNAAAVENKAPENKAVSEGNRAEDTAKAGDPSKQFSKTVEMHGISFTVESDNSSSINKLKVTPKGLEGSNETIEVEIDGGVVGAEVGDLNIDGSPEVYVFVTGAGSGSYGSVVGFVANNKKSLSQVNVPELKEGSDEIKGYMGHDEFAVVESTLVRRFPVYKEGDSNAKPTGGTRQLQYKLKQGEAAWQLVVDKVVNY